MLLGSVLEALPEPALWYQVDASDRDVNGFFHHLRVGAEHLLERALQLPLPQPGLPIGLDGFARRFFAALFEQLPARLSLVFDDQHEASEHPEYNLVFRELLLARPSGVRIYVGSRRAPPASLVRFRASGEVAVIELDALRFDTREIASLLLQRGGSANDGPALLAATGGWAIAVSLLASSTGAMGDSMCASGAGPSAALELVFAFLCGEILERLEPAARAALLALAVLPYFDAGMASELLGDENAPRLIDRLQREHALIERHEGDLLRLHALFRMSLLEQGRREHSPEMRRAFSASAGRLLAQRGQIEAAGALLGDAREWSALIELTEQHAPALVGAGRLVTLAELVDRVPPELVAARPWLLLWSGVARIGQPPLACALGERAFDAFLERADATGVLLAWSLVVQSLVRQGEDYRALLGWLERRAALPPLPDGPGIGVSVAMSELLGWAQNGARYDAVVVAHIEPALRTVLAHGSPSERVLARSAAAHALYLSGQPERALSLLAAARQSSSAAIEPFARLLQLHVELFIDCNMAGNFRRAADVLERAWALLRSEPVLFIELQMRGFGAVASFALGDVAGAREHTARVREAQSRLPQRITMNDAFQDFLCAREAVEAGDTNTALALLAESEREALGVGFSFGACESMMGRLVALTESGDSARLRATLVEVEARLGEAPTVFQAATLRVAIADARLALDELSSAELGRALRAAREAGVVGAPFFGRRLITRVARAALEYGVEREYAQRLLLAYEISPGDEALVLPGWPWPVRVRVLGGVELEVDGKPVRFGRKPPVVVVNLLKLLATSPAPLPVASVIKALWPGYGANPPRATLDTAVYRLRKLLGTDAVVHAGGALSLAADRCWSDARALCLVCERVAAARTPEPSWLMAQVALLRELDRGALADASDPPALRVAARRLEQRARLARVRLGRLAATAGPRQSVSNQSVLPGASSGGEFEATPLLVRAGDEPRRG